jgi:hypothetical protein
MTRLGNANAGPQRKGCTTILQTQVIGTTCCSAESSNEEAMLQIFVVAKLRLCCLLLLKFQPQVHRAIEPVLDGHSMQANTRRLAIWIRRNGKSSYQSHPG